MNNAKRKSTSGTADTVGGTVMTALHRRVDRVQCTVRRGTVKCGEWVDSDPVVQARHLLCCRAASWWTRARAEWFLAVCADADAAEERDVEDRDAEEFDGSDEASALLSDDEDDGEDAPVSRPTRRGDVVELSPDTAAYVEVLASEDAHLLATGDAHPRLQVVRDLWDVNFLDLPVEARLELRAHGEEVGFLFYATCLSRYLSDRAAA